MSSCCTIHFGRILFLETNCQKESSQNGFEEKSHPLVYPGTDPAMHRTGSCSLWLDVQPHAGTWIAGPEKYCQHQDCYCQYGTSINGSVSYCHNAYTHANNYSHSHATQYSNTHNDFIPHPNRVEHSQSFYEPNFQRIKWWRRSAPHPCDTIAQASNCRTAHGTARRSHRSSGGAY